MPTLVLLLSHHKVEVVESAVTVLSNLTSDAADAVAETADDDLFVAAEDLIRRAWAVNRAGARAKRGVSATTEAERWMFVLVYAVRLVCHLSQVGGELGASHFGFPETMFSGERMGGHSFCC